MNELDRVPSGFRALCADLLAGQREVLGDGLVALWCYGAMVFPESAEQVADVDFHAVLAAPPPHEGAEISSLHERLARAHGIDLGDLDGWYILLEDARRPDPPPHIDSRAGTDGSWGLHRAHWLAGRRAVLHGPPPEEIVPPPTWAEIVAGLEHEMVYVERHVADPGADGYCVANLCRIMWSFETGDPVRSKRAATEWGLSALPERWHPAVRAAQRVYEQTASQGDRALIRSALEPFLGFARARIQEVRV